MIGRGQAKHFELVMLLSFDDACVGTGKCILNSSGLQDCSRFFFFNVCKTLQSVPVSI